MTTLMQKVLAYFARREQRWYTKQVMKYLHRKSRKDLKKFKPVTIVRTFPNGTQETMSMNLYKGKFRIPVEWINEEKTKKDGRIYLVDGSTIALTSRTKLEGSLDVQL